VFRDPAFTFEKGITLYWYADGVWTVLHRVCFLPEEEDICVGLTNIQSYNCMNMFSG